MAWTFCVKQDVIEIIPVTDDELLDSWSDMVEGLIKQHLGKPNLGDYVTITDEYHHGDGTSLLKVSKPPITSVTSLLINDAALISTDYVVFGNYIQLKLGQTFPVGTLNVKVSYVSGSLDIHPTIRLAAATMIAAMVNFKRRAGADANLKWGTVETKIGMKQPISDVGLVKHLDTIMRTVLRRDRPRFG